MIKNKNTLALFLFIPAGLLIISNLITFTAGFDAFVKMIICFSSGTIIFYGFKSAKGINETITIFSLILSLVIFFATNFKGKCVVTGQTDNFLL